MAGKLGRSMASEGLCRNSRCEQDWQMPDLSGGQERIIVLPALVHPVARAQAFASWGRGR